MGSIVEAWPFYFIGVFEEHGDDMVRGLRQGETLDFTVSEWTKSK